MSEEDSTPAGEAEKDGRQIRRRIRPRDWQLPAPGRVLVGGSVAPEDRNPAPVIDTTSPLASRLGPRPKILRRVMPGPSQDIYKSYLEGGVDAIGISTVPFEGRTVEELEKSVARIRRSVEKSPYAMLVTSMEDMDKAHRQGKLGVFICNQGAPGFGDPLSRAGFIGGLLNRMEFLPFVTPPRPATPEDVAAFGDQGVMVTGIAYNIKNRLGSGLNDKDNEHGLTDQGRDYIRAGKEAGVAIDLCHLNEKTALDAVKFITEELKMPPLVSHVDCQEICDIPRNATGSDEVIRAVAAGGGVVGISALFYSMSKPGEQNNTIDRIMEHIDRVVKVAGPDHVGLGLDFWTGIAPYNPGWVQSVRDWWEVKRGLYEDRSMFHPGTDKMAPGLETPSGIHNLEKAIRERYCIKNGYAPDVPDKILGGNMQRVLGEWWRGREQAQTAEAAGRGR